MITLCIVTSLPAMLKPFKDIPSQDTQDLHIGAKQLSQYLMCAKNIKYDGTLVYQDESKIYTVSLDNHRLVKTPGFEILLVNVDDVQWVCDNQYLYMVITRKNVPYTFLVADLYQKGVGADEQKE